MTHPIDRHEDLRVCLDHDAALLAARVLRLAQVQRLAPITADLPRELPIAIEPTLQPDPVR